MKLKGIRLKPIGAKTNNILEDALDLMTDFIGVMLMCTNFSEVSIKAFVLFAVGFTLLKTEIRFKNEEI